jgi:hypothetical protein
MIGEHVDTRPSKKILSIVNPAGFMGTVNEALSEWYLNLLVTACNMMPAAYRARNGKP